ncbi:hypothetical protein Tco_0814408 [Tanacetum coccineum]
MSASNQQTLAESRASERPPLLEKGSYVPWASRFLRLSRGDTRECLGRKLTTAMMLSPRAITQRYSTPTNNRLRTSSNTRNQAVIQDCRVDIQSKNVGYAANGNSVGNRYLNNLILH